MRFRKNSASAKMEIAMTAEHSLNPRISRTFKRSKSFRASTRFMSKFQNQTNLRAVDEIEKRSSLSPLELIRKTENADSKTVDVFMAQFYSHSESKEMTDLRGIVQEVKNKLSITMRSRRKNREELGSVVDSLRSENKMADKKSSIGTGKYERANNYCKSVNEFHSYENPTFDSSFDTSVSACLYKDEPDNLDDCGNLETVDKKDSRGGKSNDEEEAVTIIVGNEARRFVESGDSRFPTTAPPGLPTDKPIAREIQTTWSSHRPPCGKHEKIYDNTFSGSKSTNNSSSWLISRGSSFRFRTANGCTTGSAGSLTSGATTVSKFHTFQGMEFLEGFGKKKHLPSNNQPNTLSVNINPLTAQPSHNIHVHALFSAVEHGHLDKARTILESTDVDVNSVNSDGLSALDVAVLGSNKSLAKMLVAFGAQEGNRFESPESLGSHMASLLLTAEQRVQELGGTTTGNSILDPANCRNDFTTSHNSLTRCTEPTDEKQLALWERRVRALRKMLLGFEQARPPDVPLLVAVDVTGTTSIVLKFQESEVHESSICTKFKVQWSTCDDFTNICGERQVMDMKQRECRIDRLSHGQRYHLRVAAGNIKGWSRYAASTPAYVTPSSWRDLENKQPRYFGRVDQLETVFSSIRRPEYGNEAPALQRRNHKKKTTTIKQLFSATSKFQKTLRRGVFLACLLYHEDKILVTNEDFLPVIEVDETYSPSCIYNDFHWLMKVSCTWNDVKSLRHDMEKCQGSSSNHLKMKLLQAAGQMQAALCVQDLGQIYHKPLRDVHGTMVISIVNYVKSPKSVSVLNGRWLPLNKVNKKTIAHDNNNVADILMNSIQSQMAYHQLSSIKLTRGLYLGYLRMQSSVDFVQVFVSAKAPNILPHCKIRDNPHVSAEEWEYLKRITRIPSSETSQAKVEEKENAVNESSQGTEQQKLFVDLVSATSRRLFSYMNVTAEDSQIHRLYDAEVIELTSQVSLIVVVPPPEVACSAPGTREVFLQRDDLLSLPIQVFEMVHLSTYQKKMINLYSRLSCILELDTAQARHNHREAFSSTELSVAKERLANLQDLQCQINTIWKGARWLVDLITFARDRGTSGQLHLQTSGISMKSLLSIDKNRNKNSGSTSSNNNINTNGGHSLKRSLLQLPPRDPKLVKSSPGRGSWPGPNLLSSSTSSNLLTTELSKSEQQLPNGGATGHYTRKVSHDATNFTSELSAAKFSGNRETSKLSGRLPISKSEDSILLTKYKHSPRNRSVNSLTLVSGNASPAINTKTFAYGRTFVPTSMTNTSSIATTTSDSMHSLNGAGEDYTFGNSNQAHGKTKSIKPTASVAAVATPSLEDQLDRKKQDEATVMPAPLPGILQVYAAYETGLASGTSLKLHVTPRTTAREVVDLVVKQLNMAIVLKGQEGPIYTADQLPNFCLVAVIGARERCLRDDFKPLQLQNPWKKGRLYVRQKQDVLAALEHSSKQTAYL